MKKNLLTKLGLLALGLAMTVVTGVAIKQHTVEAKAADTYELASSIAVGDTVVLACNTKSMELSGISTTSTKYGIGVAYSGSPAGAYPLTVEAGSTSGTYSFKHSSGSYLCWTSGNSLSVNATKNANTSWNVTFSGTTPTIENAKDNARKLQWNASSPRFACYSGSQTAVALFKIASQEGLTRITIGGTLSKISYTDADEWDPSGLTVTASYTASGDVDVTSDVTWSYNPVKPEVGLNSVKVTATYDGKTDTMDCDVEVTGKVYDISGNYYIKHTKNKTTYYLQANGTSGAPKAVTNKSEATVIYFELVGVNTFVLYTNSDKTKWLYCTNDNDGVRSGDTNNNKNWKISGKKTESTGDYTLQHVGTSRFLTLYNTQDFRCYTNVATNRTEDTGLEAVVEATSLTISASDNAQTRFLKGSEFSYTDAGYTAHLIYSDGNSEDVSSSCTWTLDTSAVTTTAEITATYQTFTATYENIEIFEETIASIRLDITNAKTTYNQGDTLDTTNIVIEALNSNGDTIVNVDVAYCTFTPTTLNEAGTITITVTWGELSSSYNVEVTEASLAFKVSSTQDLWDGQQVYIANAVNNAVAQNYIEGNNLDSNSATFLNDSLNVNSISAEAPSSIFTIGRVKVDANFYYTFFDGTNYLYAASGSSNQLKGKKDIDLSCYWNISFDENGVVSIINADTNKRGVMQYNKDNSLFSCYKSATQSVVELYAVTKYNPQAVANAFIDNYMHLEDYTEGTGLCAGENGYYAKAKEVFNAMNDDERFYFSENVEAYARLQAWAYFNGEKLNGDMVLEPQASGVINLNMLFNDKNNTSTILIVIAIALTFGTTTIFLSRRRKHN